MNFIVDLSFPFKIASVSVKIIHNLLFVEACEFQGVKGIDCTKRFFKKCKRIDYTAPIKMKAYYKRGVVRIIDSGERKRGEQEIVIKVTHATPRKKPLPPPQNSRCIPYDELKANMRLMGFDL